MGLFCVCIGIGASVQGASLWSEGFNYSDGSLTNNGWTVTEHPFGAAVVSNGQCSLLRIISTNVTPGCIAIYQNMSSNAPGYKTVLRENDQTVSWGIRINDVNFNPGVNFGDFQYGYILAASSADFKTEGCGYFIGTDGKKSANGTYNDFLYLGSYSNGLQGTIHPVINTEFELGWNSAYDRAAIRVDYDPVSSVWRLYADRNSGLDPASLTNLEGTIRADSTYTASNMPYLGLVFNFREYSPTYSRSLDFDLLSLWTSSQQAQPRIPGASGGGVDYDYFIGLVEVRVSDYVNFLNQTQIPQGLTVQNGLVKNAGGDVYCSTVSGNASAYVTYNNNLPLAQRFSAVADKEDHPMVFVSWFGAAAYCNWKSQSEGLEPVYDAANGWSVTTNRGYRLPTEAEWRKAAAWQPESGTYALYGTASNTIKSAEANFLASGDAFETNTVRTVPVAGYPGVSAYALRDASGNVWEWCHDFFDAGQTDTETSPRVVRGGGWGNLSKDITTEVRNGSKPGQMNNSTGFRTVIPVE